MTRNEGVLALNEFQSAGCLILILKVQYAVDCKHSSKSCCKCWCDALRDSTPSKVIIQPLIVTCPVAPETSSHRNMGMHVTLCKHL